MLKKTDGQISKIIKNKNRTVNYYEKLVKKYNLTFKWVENFDEFLSYSNKKIKIGIMLNLHIA